MRSQFRVRWLVGALVAVLQMCACNKKSPPELPPPTHLVRSSEISGCPDCCPPPKPCPIPHYTCNGKKCPNGACIPDGACCPTDGPSVTCDDNNACTYGDHCDGAGHCVGTAITCTSTTCQTLACNGTATCGVASNAAAGTICDDRDGCTLYDRCDGAGTCRGTGSVPFCSTTVCAGQGCDGVSDYVSTIRVDATGKGMVTFQSALATSAPCCNSSASCNRSALAFDASTAGGKATLALATAAKLGGKKLTAIGTGACSVYPGTSATPAEDWTYGTLVGP